MVIGTSLLLLEVRTVTVIKSWRKNLGRVAPDCASLQSLLYVPESSRRLQKAYESLFIKQLKNLYDQSDSRHRGAASVARGRQRQLGVTVAPSRIYHCSAFHIPKQLHPFRYESFGGARSSIEGNKHSCTSSAVISLVIFPFLDLLSRCVNR